MAKKTSIYLNDDIRKMIRCPEEGSVRGASSAASVTISRYDAIVSPEKKRLERIFTSAEWKALYLSCKGIVLFDANTGKFISQWKADEIRGKVLLRVQDTPHEEFSVFKIDHKDLESKLALLSIPQQYALVEMIEEHWEGKKPSN